MNDKAKEKKAKPKPKLKMTAKQARVQAQNITKGLDNTVAAIEAEAKRSIDSIRKKLGAVRDISSKAKNLVSGLSNLEVPVKAVKKAPAPAKAPAKPKSSKKKAPAKAKAPAKPKKATPAKKVEGSKSPKDPVPGRPVLREAIHQLLAGSKRMKKTDLREALEEKWGYWSRQSVYSMLNRDPRIQEDDDGLVFLQEDVDKFVDKASGDPSVAQVV